MGQADKQCEVPQVLSAIPLRYLVQCQRINNLPALKQEQHSRPETYENELCRWYRRVSLVIFFLKGDKIMSTNKITCSFTVDRDIYNAYKSIVVKGGENVKGNLIRYMLNVINYETPNADTISAIKEVEELKKIQTKKPMHHLASF